MPALPRLRFPLLALLLSLPVAWLVFMQATTTNSAYPSDVGMHILFVKEADHYRAENYSLLHTLAGQLARVPDAAAGASRNQGVAGAFVILLAAAFYLSLDGVHRYLQRRYPEASDWRTAAVTAGIFGVSMLLLGPLHASGYVGPWSPNPWHNPTFLLSRAFAIPVFLRFVALMESPDLPLSPRAWTELALLGALGMWAKPSFLLSFLITAAVFLLYRWLRRGNDLRVVVRLGSAFLPAVATLVAIWMWVYAQPVEPAAKSSVVLSPGSAWSQYAPNLLIAILLGMAFPLYAVLTRCRRLTPALAVGLVHYLTSTAVFYLLAETGPRATHANFAWTYIFGMFFLFLTTAEDWFLRRPEPKRAWWWLGTVLFLWHLGSGGWYLAGILRGHAYY